MIRPSKQDRERLPAEAKRLLNAVLMEFASRAGVCDVMTEEQALQSMHDLLDVGAIAVASDGETFWLDLPEVVTVQ